MDRKRCNEHHHLHPDAPRRERSPVAPDTVLPDEPGWLPPYTDDIL